MRAIIIGHSGQDGTLLCESLEEKGCELIGISRSSITTIPYRNIEEIPRVDDAKAIELLIKDFQPTEIYYLAAYHASSEVSDIDNIRESFINAEQTHVIGLLNILCAVRDNSPSCKIFYASSSLVFSGEDGELQNEKTPLSPSCFYGVTKAQAMWLCDEFRNKYGIFVSVGILYNHESYLRPPHFLTQKIIKSAIRISNGSDEKLTVGNLSARVDWSYARDFIEAFQLILALDESKSFVIASNEAHTVQEFIEVAFEYFNLDWTQYVNEDNSILIRKPLVKIGDSSKLTSETGWNKTYNFHELVKQLVIDSNI